MNNWKPNGYNSVSPYLISQIAEQEIAFIVGVFKGHLIRRFDRPDGSIMHAEVRIDDTVIMLGGGATDQQSTTPHVHVYVDDVDAVYKRAIKFGALSLQEPLQKRHDDDFRAGFKDASGVTWWVASQFVT